MNTFNKKSLCTALASLGALGATGAAMAVNVNPNGLGQVLIYPYYTVRGASGVEAAPYNTLLSVVNTSASAKAVKVRILEGKNSREVLDFNLFLSARDVWTAAITPTAAAAKLATTDKSCTLPAIPAAGVEFVNYAYVGNSDDKGGADLDRTREGYIEIIEMGAITGGTTTEAYVTHGANGAAPPGCGSLTDTQANTDTTVPTGGLFGGATLVSVLAGTDFSSDAVALDNFSDTKLYTNAGVITPNLSQASPPVSVVSTGTSGTQVQTFKTNWTGSASGADPVSAVLMHDAVMNEFVLDKVTKSGTDWVLAFPTKGFYVGVGTGNATRLFQRNFNSTAGSCDDVAVSAWDREEFRVSRVDFSPPPPTAAATAICWEVSVVTFNDSNVLGSKNKHSLTTSFENGWMVMGFPLVGSVATAHNLPAPANQSWTVSNGGLTIPTVAANANLTYFGLPVIGFAAQTFINGTLSCPTPSPSCLVQSNYGGNFVQKATTKIQ